MNLQKYYNELTSERLIFRKLTQDDVKSLEEFFVDRTNLKYLDIDTNRTPYAMAKAWVDTQQARYAQNKFGQLAMVSKQNNELIGTRGFGYCMLDEHTYLTSMCIIKKAYWQQGYSSESTNCLFDYVFENKLTNAIMTFCHVDNTATRRNLQRSGSELMKTIHREGRPTCVYLLLAEQWMNKGN